MTARQLRRYAMLVPISKFGAGHRDRFFERGVDALTERYEIRSGSRE